MLTGWLLIITGAILILTGVGKRRRGNKELKGASTSYLEFEAITKLKYGAVFITGGCFLLFVGFIALTT